MAESNTYVGVTSGTGVAHRGTYQLLTSRQKISTSIQWAAFTKTPFMRMLALEAFGVDAVTDIEKFGVAETSGRMIVYHKGVHSFAGSIFATAGNSTHVGRFGSFTPQIVEGGDEWIYSWHRLIMSDFIPDVDVQDNGNGYIDIKAQKTQGMKQQYVQHINYAFLGNSSAPNHGVLGPSSVNHDLANLISVTQDKTVGGISKSGNTFWNNGSKAIASIGGGG